jgi:FAD/FMN-containing dehydrogenase
VLVLGDDGYDDARLAWNSMHDRRPGVIVRVANGDDVTAAIRFATERGLEIAVRGGGHNVAGNGTTEGGILVDLADLDEVAVDPAAQMVRAGGGATLADLDAATEPSGLIVPAGVISGTGIGGLTLGGGVGWLTRAFGLTIDALVAADVVLADGRRVRALADEEPELFWAIRGGGGNFGVVTAFEFRAWPIGPEVFGGTFVYGRPAWAGALRAFDAWTADLPDELTAIGTFITPLPEMEMGDETLLLVGFTWAGEDPADAERLVAPLREAAPPDAEEVGRTRWVEWQSAADGWFVDRPRAYWKNVALDAMPDGAIEAIVEHCARLPSASTGFDIHHLGGAVARVADDATAFPNRSARFWLNAYATWRDPADDERAIAWARGLHAALAPFAAAGEYVNFLGADPTADPGASALAAYGPAKLARLRAAKRRYDPDNVFRRNHNILPA